MIPTDRNVSLPDPVPVSNHAFRLIGTHVQNNDRAFLATTFDELISREVIKRDRSHLHNIRLKPETAKWEECFVDLFTLHRKQADFGHGERHFVVIFIHVVFRSQLLVIPNHFIQWKWDLLFGFVLNDLGDSLLLDWREFDEFDQTLLAWDADRNPAAVCIVFFEELNQSHSDKFIRVGIGLTQNLRVFHTGHFLDQQLVWSFARYYLQSFECDLADIYRPNRLNFGHVRQLPQSEKQSGSQNRTMSDRPELPSRKSLTIQEISSITMISIHS